MPSGRTHDRVTLWSLPVVAALTFGQTRSGLLTLIISGGFLLGGLMFGPDLDIYSRQYQRWGWFRWIWRPYQDSLRHRAFLSHGPLIGTALRMVYFGIWIAVFAILALTIAQFFTDMASLRQWLMLQIARSFTHYYQEWIALYIGLELGAMSHSLMDWGGSAYKRLKKQGWRAFLTPTVNIKIKKRKTKSTTRSKGKKLP
ncbi:MAG: hypothetical protein RLZZ338_3255 [Cyanobacteriota bacterium]|jgi:uncharacterized metal-binding protein